jgi:hypothetical protein
MVVVCDGSIRRITLCSYLPTNAPYGLVAVPDVGLEIDHVIAYAGSTYMDDVRKKSILKKLTAWSISLFVLFLASPAFAVKLDVVYPRPESDADIGRSYPIELLELALAKAGSPYKLRPSHDSMQQNRALRQLTDDAELSVVWSMTSKERESELLPIRIPIDKGLLGWRIFFVNRNDAKRFEQVQNLDQLRSLSAGQEHDWPDVEILTANRLKVVQSSNYESLFKMLDRDRFDYLPRSIDEIWDEEKAHSDLNIAVEQTIILHYPAAEYFFVNKNNTALAGALEKGLRLAIKDGSFDRLFTKYNGESIRRANIKNRRVFKLDNPLLPEATPLDQKELWFNQ